MRDLAESIELAGTHPDVNVQPRSMCACWVIRAAGSWKAGPWSWQTGRGTGTQKMAVPWFYARQAESFEINGDSIRIDGTQFTSKRLQNTLQQAEAHSVVLVAVGAGPEAEEEAQRRWQDEKPDEYFFLEIFGSAVVEHLVTTTGARLCDWAERHDMAVLPHSVRVIPNGTSRNSRGCSN